MPKMTRNRWMIIAVVVVIALAVIASLYLFKTPDATDPRDRVTVQRYDDTSATFVITGTSNAVVAYNGSIVYMAVHGHETDPYEWSLNWTGSSSAMMVRYENASFLLLIEDLDGNKMVSNGDSITLVALDGFVPDWQYSFWLYDKNDADLAYLYGTFTNFH